MTDIGIERGGAIALLRHKPLRGVIAAAGILLTTLGVGDLMELISLIWSQRGFAVGEAFKLTQD
jgi:hypothetical protein